MTEKLYFTFVIVARNAGKHLPNAFADFLAQDFPRDQLEFLFVDSLSDDDSLALAKEFKTAHKDINFTILTNPNRILASGWNVALQHAKGNILLRLDAHARIPPDFIRLNTENILKGHFITGGTLATTLPQETWPRFVGLANSCKFGASSAPFRKTGNNAEREVKTLAYAAYRREIFDKVGGYHELLPRTEDIEMHWRMRKAGYKFHCIPAIKPIYTPRSSFTQLLSQKFQTGNGVGLTALAVSPKCCGPHHFVPFAFLVALALCAAMALTVSPLPLYLLGLIYVCAALYYTGECMRGERATVKLLSPLMPLMFLFIHLSYGAGTLYGILRTPFVIRRYRNYKIPLTR